MGRGLVRSALLFLSICLCFQNASAQSGGIAPSLVISRPNYDPQTEQLFDAALNKIWMMAGAGLQEYEAGFALNRVGDHYQIVFAHMTFERNMELKIPVNTIGVTIAVAHTHPDSGDDVPSGHENDKSGQGDVFSPVPNFVVSRSGVWVTDPVTHSYRKVRGGDWARNGLSLASADVLARPEPAISNDAELVGHSRTPVDTRTLEDVKDTLYLGQLP